MNELSERIALEQNEIRQLEEQVVIIKGRVKDKKRKIRDLEALLEKYQELLTNE